MSSQLVRVRKQRSGESKETGTTKQRKTTTASAKRKRVPPSPRLLNIEERKQVVNSVAKEEVLTHVYKTVPSQLVSHLFPERKVYWK